MTNKDWMIYDPEMDYLSENTQKLLDKAVASTKEFIKVSPTLSETQYRTRGAHARSYAYAKALFKPHEDTISGLNLSDTFFEEQDMLIRFSNANNVIVSDKKNFPAYGMTLMFDKGLSYPLVNFPLFPTDDVDSFLKLFIDLNEARVAQAKSGWKAITELPSLMSSTFKALYHINPLNVGNLLWKGVTLDQDFILNYAFHGIGAYRFGNYVAKIHTQKMDFKFEEEIETDNLQKVNLQNILDQDKISFKIYIQLGIDDKSTPVNTLSKEWSQEKSPWQILGTIHIPQQQLIENSMDLEKMAFNPFYNPKELQPVGRIQQTRKPTYAIAEETRGAKNKAL